MQNAFSFEVDMERLLKDIKIWNINQVPKSFKGLESYSTWCLATAK